MHGRMQFTRGRRLLLPAISGIRRGAVKGFIFGKRCNLYFELHPADMDALKLACRKLLSMSTLGRILTPRPLGRGNERL